ncbi:ribosomal biogenesis protein [Caldivirga sp.]|uniref:Brix domain-containing protein n=1 Tax=Caldivirga sp. TaxID=2080243 RepID=UPI0025BEC836|nr:ribosomal biogenesis protein [Caldivirga sp.]
MVVVLTTSRDASIRLRQFVNELELAIPNAVKVNRGRSGLIDIASVALGIGANYIVMFTSFHGNPSSIVLYRIREDTLIRLPYVITLGGVKLLRDLLPSRPILSKPASMVIVTQPGVQLALILSEVFEVSLFYGNLDDYRNFESIMYIKPVRGECCEVSFIDGLTYAPRGPIIKVKRFKEVNAPGLVVKRLKA